MRKVDLAGRIFGHLTVLEEAPKYVSPNGYEKCMWHCRCNICGQVTTVMGSHLTSGHTTSCGCQKLSKLSPRKAESLVGRKFGLLEVIYRMPNRQIGANSRVVWHCRCDCGNETDVLALLLREGLVKSCGCLLVSHAERLMSCYLSDHGVDFDKQYSPETLVGVGGGRLKFDFYVHASKGSFLVELDGIQHKEPVRYFGGESKYLTMKDNDMRKDVWAAEVGIILIRIDVSKCYHDSDFISLYDDTLISYITS